MIETRTKALGFELSGNVLCLDFTNTLHDRPGDHPQELLNSYSDLVAWSQEEHLLTDDEAQRLDKESASHPTDAAAVLKRAIVLREAIYRIFLAIAEGSSPAEADLTALNTALSEAMAQARIVLKEHGFAWDWTGNEDSLDRMLWSVVRSAADLMASNELDVVRVCASDDCNWLFLDTSKNRSRRWCDMKSCGNRAKARRHYERRRQSSNVVEPS